MSSEEKPKAMPIPEKGQDRATYIAEELGKDLYEGKVTFEMVANDPEYQPVRDHPNWKAMMEMENKSEDKPKDGATMPDGAKADSNPAPVEPPKQDAPSQKMAPPPPLVGIDPGPEDIPDPPEMESSAPEPDTPVYKSFDPEYRRSMKDIFNKAEFDMVGPLIMAKDTGISDLMNESNFDPQSTKESQLMKFLQNYVGCFFVQGSSRSDMFTPLGEHNISPELKPQQVALDRLEYEISFPDAAFRAQMENVNENTILLTTAPARDNVLALPITNYNFLPNEEVVSRRVYVNPHRLPFLMAGIRTSRFLFMRRDLFLNPAMNPMLEADLLRDIREMNGGEEDKISNNMLKLSVFPRMTFDGGAYYFDLMETNDLRLYSEIIERSCATARGFTDHMTPSSTILSFPSRGQVAETVAKLNQLGSGDAATMAKELATFYAGGYGCELSIDFSSMLSGDIARLRPMCCMAYLLLLDKSMISYDTHHKLLTGVLAPFFDEVDTPARVGFGGPVRVRLGAASLARDILQAGAVTRNQLDENFSLLLGGKQIQSIQRNERRYVVRILFDLINMSFGVLHQRIPRQRSLITYVRGGRGAVLRPFAPFISAPGLNESVIFGTTPHYTDDYVPEVSNIMNNLILFSECLSRRPDVGAMLPLMQHGLRNTRIPARSVGLMMEAIVQATTHSDCIPFRNNARVRGALPAKTFTLPFAGALSFFMFGVESSKLIDDGEKFLRFEPVTSYKLPSLYPSYVFLEKAIANEVYAAFAPQRFHILIPKKLVELCLSILKVYYVSIDPASERRLTLMFDEHQRFLAAPNNAERVPAQMKFTAQPGLDAMLNRDDEIQGEIAYGLAKLDTPEDARPLGGLRTLQHHIEVKERRVDTVYIATRTPIAPIFHVNNKGQSVALYVMEEVPAEDLTTSLDAVLDTLYSTQLMTFDMKSLRQIAENMGFQYIKIDKLTTKINLIEQKGFTDEPTAEPVVKISRKKERAERKFEIDSIDIYYRLNYDEYSRQIGNIPGRGNLNPMFATYVGMLWDDLMKYAINYDGYKLDEPGLYNLDKNLRIRDGAGFIYSTPLNIATRESEEFVVESAINLRA